MAHENITTAVDNNPNLSMLADAIKKTDLASTLNGLKDSTVFVPTNDAFNKLGTAKKDALLNDRAQQEGTHLPRGRAQEDHQGTVAARHVHHARGQHRHHFWLG
ncbi:hypothetical protein SVIOM342S_10416 [Streptomyces violaceorubidus]